MDKRVLEYAYNFFKDPDGNLLKIARRLETEIKKKAEEGGGSYSSVTGSTLYKTLIFPGERKNTGSFLEWHG